MDASDRDMEPGPRNRRRKTRAPRRTRKSERHIEAYERTRGRIGVWI